MVEGEGFISAATDAGDLEALVEKDLAGGVASKFGEGGGEAVFERGEHGLGRGLLAVFDQVVSDASAPTAGPGGIAA